MVGRPGPGLDLGQHGGQVRTHAHRHLDATRALINEGRKRQGAGNRLLHPGIDVESRQGLFGELRRRCLALEGLRNGSHCALLGHVLRAIAEAFKQQPAQLHAVVTIATVGVQGPAPTTCRAEDHVGMTVAGRAIADP